MTFLTNPLDIALLAVAIVTIGKLYFILGKHTENDTNPRHPSRVEVLPEKSTITAAAQTAATPNLTIENTMKAFAKLDTAFSAESFLAGATSAHQRILQDYARQDFTNTKNLLSTEILDFFNVQISGQTPQNNHFTAESMRPAKAEIIAAELRQTIAQITVHFQAAANGDEEINDVWTFERDLKSSDPNWLLIRTEGLEL